MRRADSRDGNSASGAYDTNTGNEQNPADETNDVLYQAIMAHKQEQSRRTQTNILETHSIAESQHRKKMEAQHAKSVVLASTNYATSNRYVEINTGNDHRIKLKAGMHPLNADECDVYTALVENCPGSSMQALMNHHVSETGGIEGFRFTCSPTDKGSALPMCRKMFFRYTMVECATHNDDDIEESNSFETDEDVKILELLKNQRAVGKKLVELVRKIHAESIGNEASFDCMPENTDHIPSAANMNSCKPMLSAYAHRRGADCREWNPEMPEFVGIYHAYVKGFNKARRAHKLFIVIGGGCSKMSDAYYNLVVASGSGATVEQVLESEETWYLRKANERCCNRIATMVADEFRLIVPKTADPYSHEPREIAIPTTETMLYDLIKQKDGRVAMTSLGMNTLSCRNGILCRMHPSEGIWLFKGPVQTSSGMTKYGGAFGAEDPTSTFPVCTTKVHPRYSWRSKCVPGSNLCKNNVTYVASQDNSAVFRLDHNAEFIRPKPEAHTQSLNERYTYMDESCLRSLQQDVHWNRDNGIIELVPIAVVLQQIDP